MGRLITDWSTDDPQIAETLKRIASVPEYTSLREELEATLHMAQARFCLERAARYRAAEQDRAIRQARAARRSSTR